MKTLATALLCLAGLTLLMAGIACAQPPQNAPAPPPPLPENAPEIAPPPPPHALPGRLPEERGKMRWRGEKSMDADTRALLEEVMIARMSQELALDDEQTVLMVRRFSQFRDQLREMRKQRAEMAKELKALIKQNKEDASIEEKLNALTTIDEKIIQARVEAFNNAAADLTPWQRAKLYLFISEFENEIRGIMQKAREQRYLQDGMGPGAMSPKGPAGKGPSGLPGKGRSGRGQGGSEN
ncbi:MAG TPA: hypothetical protein PLI09_20335 [Candidatus Hydrogenedentes bacterium]|nr:hypothetical protein [Candidatus Hydrogenedentota bacterium]